MQDFFDPLQYPLNYGGVGGGILAPAARRLARWQEDEQAMTSDNMRSAQQLDRIHEAFVDAAWRGLYWVCWLALPISAWRTLQFGWTPGFTLVLATVSAVFAVRALRARLSLGVKRWLLLAALWLGSLAGLSSFGIAGASLTLLTTSSFIAAMLLPPRRALLVIGAGLLTLAAFGAAYVSGALRPALDLNRFSAMASSWVNLVIVVSGLSVMMAMAVGTYRRAVEQLLLEVVRQRDEIEHLATHDKLTGLPALRLATDRADQALWQARQAGEKVALMFVDLDGFKAVNDGFGHEAGDHVLAEAARRLRACVRSTDTAARIGGDEFMVVLAGLHHGAEAAEVADKIVRTVAQPVAWGNAQLQVGASVGIALYPDHAQDTLALRRVADAAMYRVKRSGKSASAFGSPA